MKNLLLAIFLLSFIQITHAFSAHVSDDLQVNLRTGPSIKYRLAGTLASGESFKVIDTKSSKKFYKIITQTGKAAWIAKSKTQTGQSIKAKNILLEESMAKSVALIKKQSDEIHRLKLLLNEQKLKSDKQSTTESQLNLQISSLSNQIASLDDSNLIRWFTHASIVTLFGLFLLFIASFFRKRKNYSEFN